MDRILMSDFNSDNSKIDTALKTQADAIADEAAARNALAQTVAAKGNCQIAYGTYTGSGTNDDSHPNSLTFPFEPKLVVVQNQAWASGEIASSMMFDKVMMIMVRPLQVWYHCGGTYQNTITWTGNTVRWWGNSPELQLNDANTVYSYVALG